MNWCNHGMYNMRGEELRMNKNGVSRCVFFAYLHGLEVDMPAVQVGFQIFSNTTGEVVKIDSQSANRKTAISEQLLFRRWNVSLMSTDVTSLADNSGTS